MSRRSIGCRWQIRLRVHGSSSEAAAAVRGSSSLVHCCCAGHHHRRAALLLQLHFAHSMTKMDDTHKNEQNSDYYAANSIQKPAAAAV
jgi:hypothetical protein